MFFVARDVSNNDSNAISGLRMLVTLFSSLSWV